MSEEVDSKLVKAVNEAAALARNLHHARAERVYVKLVADASRTGAVATGEFIATARMRHAFCLMDLHRYGDALVALEKASALAQHLDEAGRYELLFAKGNTQAALGALDEAFKTLVEAISIAEDMDDYTDRPGQCWASILRHGAEHQAWTFLENKAAIALNTAQLRGMADLAILAATILTAAKEQSANC